MVQFYEWCDTVLRKTFVERAGFYSEYILKNLTPAYTDEEIIDLKTIVDLTSKMGTDGRLEWDVPEGDWVIMRFAHESTGGPSKHGRANLKGLECDKMSVEAVTTQWNNYAARMIDTLSAINVKPDGVIMDSHEAGAQNWTPGFEQEFLRRSVPLPYPQAFRSLFSPLPACSAPDRSLPDVLLRLSSHPSDD